tara:strand:+ start:455 stop:2374 length:1920 start_codon:yes stop_codon:yes gene_type:complete
MANNTATNIIYKGQLDGTQVNFETGNLTDISTFTGDVRGVAIQDSITDGVTDIGASQDAIHSMSGYLAANAHPSVTPASNVSINNSSGTVLQDASFTFDADGHVTSSEFVSKNLDDIYSTKNEVNSISGALRTDIGTNDTELGDLRTATGYISGQISSNDAELLTLRTATGYITGLIGSNDTELTVLRTATGYLENEIDSLQAVSGSFLSLNLDDVTDVNAVTTNDITVGDIRVGGGTITGPATITIDPDAAGADGKVIIAGDLQVDGTTTTINSTSVQIDDLSLVLGTGVPNAAAADGGGIIIDGTGAANVAEFTFDGTNNRWKTNGIDIAADLVGTASSAEVWATSRTITLGGDLTGSVSFNGGSDETLTTTIAADAVQAVHLNDDIGGDNITITNGVISVADGDIRAAVFPSSSTLSIGKALVSDANGKVVASATIGSSELDHLDGIDTNIKTGLDAKALKTITMSASDGLTGGGTLAADRSFSTTADQGHLDEIELGTSNTTASNVITKGGVLILRGTDNNGITTSGSDGNAIALNDKTTVSFEGVVQSIDTAQDADNGTYVAMWKIQGVIRRDSNSTDMLSSFVTKTFGGSSASSYCLDVSVNGNGLKIANDQTTSTLVTSATINYNWIEDTSA